MATCVVALTYDPDYGHLAYACNVHCSFDIRPDGACGHQGKPASPVALHAWADHHRAETVAFWRERTNGQRPLVIHCLVWPQDHNTSGEAPYSGCGCGAEVIEAVA
jgi:hypothetical protein